MSNILVTGAAGFIGSHLCERLVSRGDRVIGLDNFDDFYSPQIKMENLKGLLSDQMFTLVRGDVRDKASLVNILSNHGIENVVHLAARAGVRPSIINPDLYVDVNVRGLVSLLEAMKDVGIKKLAYASSSSVYGNSNVVPFSEDQRVDFPISPYAATKKAGELLCYNYHHLYGLDVSCLRFFTVHGPRQRPEMAIHKFVRQVMNGEKVVLYGDGSTSRDYTYIDDIINGTVAALDALGGFKVFNLGNSHPYKLIDLLSVIEDACGKKANIEFSGQQAGDVETTYAEVSKAKAQLDYRPAVTLPEGVKRFVEWYKRVRNG
ncbi:MAG: GDP-mannose 4,6-dehydratase [Bacteroidetes bacterium]|nr:GDP-mannose 4,6-dehydratase [Bacteroidota bacterium]